MDPTNQPTADTVQPTIATLPEVQVVAPDAPLNPTGPIVVAGEVVTPETHRFKDGAPIIGKNGKALRRPGPSKGVTYKKVQTVVVAAPAAQPVDTSPTETSPAPAAAPVVAAAVAPTPTPAVEAPKQTTATTLATTAVVTRTYGKIGAPEISDEKLEVRTFVTAPASVEIGYGLTLNIGNYESARIDVKLSVPCYREEADEAFAYAKKWAEERVQQEVKEVRKIASGTKSNTPF